jgi:hypothetical protein
MEIPEMMRWISLDFVPSHIVLEAGSHQLATGVSAKPLLNLRSGK